MGPNPIVHPIDSSYVTSRTQPREGNTASKIIFSPGASTPIPFVLVTDTG
jgi:hypothetical protein